MDLKEFSKSELASILELIDLSHSCKSSDQLRQILLRARALLEADNAACGLARISGSRVFEAVSVINASYPDEWLDTYMDKSLYLKDPVVMYHTRFSTTRLWDEILNQTGEDTTNEVVSLAHDFGLRHGVSSSIYIPGPESISIFCFAGGKDTFTEHHKKLADILTLHLNQALMKTTYGVRYDAEAGRLVS